MKYIERNNIVNYGIKWGETIKVIEKAVRCLEDRDFAQPIKPYLRYRDLNNRIIAMPAFLGGEFNVSGIKWIASFPENINKGIPRANSVVILNNADTGEPLCTINTPLLSIIRTASVSGLIIKKFLEVRKRENLKVGIIGFGPIGQNHLKMCLELLQEKINKIYLYDIRDIDKKLIDDSILDKVIICKSWEEAYLDSDIFMTCTVSKAPYIDKPPKQGSLHLNVSLRDYKTIALKYFENSILVDDWEEVCRENTDIEKMYLEKAITKEKTHSIIDIVCKNYMETYDETQPVIFNPMGMAVFDIAMAKYYLINTSLA